MDENDNYPAAKRRRTSSNESGSSRESSQNRDHNRTIPIRHTQPYQRSRSESRRRSRSRSSRRERSESQSSEYSPPAYSRYESRSVSPVPVQTQTQDESPTHQAKPQQQSRSLNFTPLVTLPRAHARGITCAKFSPDFSLLATASADSTINIYSVPTNPQPNTTTSTTFKLLRTLRAHLAGVNAIAWSPQGPPYTLASASDDKSIMLWSPLTSDFPISPSPLTGHSNYVYSLAFSPKGNMLVTGSYDEAVFLWDIRSAFVMRNLPAHSDPVRSVDFLRDGTMVCSCAADGLIRIWDAGTGQCLKTLVDEDRPQVSNVRFSPNGKFLFAWTLDNCVRLWRYTEGTCVKTYQGHINKEFSVGGCVGSYSYNGNTEAFLVSGSEDGDLVAWDVTTKEILWRGKGHKDVVLGVEYGKTKDGRGLLVSVGKDRDVRVWIEEVDSEELKRRVSRSGMVNIDGGAGAGQDGEMVGEYLAVDTPDIDMEREVDAGEDEDGEEVNGVRQGEDGNEDEDEDMRGS